MSKTIRNIMSWFVIAIKLIFAILIITFCINKNNLYIVASYCVLQIIIIHKMISIHKKKIGPVTYQDVKYGLIRVQLYEAGIKWPHYLNQLLIYLLFSLSFYVFFLDQNGNFDFELFTGLSKSFFEMIINYFYSLF